MTAEKHTVREDEDSVVTQPDVWSRYVKTQREAKEIRLHNRRILNRKRNPRMMTLADFRSMVVEARIGNDITCECMMCVKEISFTARARNDRACVRYIVGYDYGGKQEVSNGAIVCLECAGFMAGREYKRVQSFYLDKKRFTGEREAMEELSALSQTTALSSLLASMEVEDEGEWSDEGEGREEGGVIE